MNETIIITVKALGWLLVVVANLGLVLIASLQAWKIYKHVMGWALVTAAVSEFKKTHPEKYKKLKGVPLT
jgi:hypothetical protein